MKDLLKANQKALEEKKTIGAKLLNDLPDSDMKEFLRSSFLLAKKGELNHEAFIKRYKEKLKDIKQ